MPGKRRVQRAIASCVAALSLENIETPLTHGRDGCGVTVTRGKRHEARGKRQETRGKRQETRGKRQETREALDRKPRLCSARSEGESPQRGCSLEGPPSHSHHQDCGRTRSSARRGARRIGTRLPEGESRGVEGRVRRAQRGGVAPEGAARAGRTVIPEYRARRARSTDVAACVLDPARLLADETGVDCARVPRGQRYGPPYRAGRKRHGREPGLRPGGRHLHAGVGCLQACRPPRLRRLAPTACRALLTRRLASARLRVWTDRARAVPARVPCAAWRTAPSPVHRGHSPVHSGPDEPETRDG
jgi:hypothetical protein